MKHRFLLDENVLHHAIRGVDNHDNPDFTCADLILQIASNCHRITLNQFLHRRYMTHLKMLKTIKSGVLQPVFVLATLVQNSLKFVWESDNPPALPTRCVIPAEDIEVVRAALISHPKFVTSDDDLRAAINNCEALHLEAMLPADALVLARDT